MRRVGPPDSVLRRRDDDFDIGPKPRCDRITNLLTIEGAIGNEPGDGRVDLGQKFRKRRGITDAFQRQIGTEDLAAEKIEPKVQFAPGAAFPSGLVLFLEPFAGAEYLEPGAVDHPMYRLIG
nr:hypothetical protein [Pseudaminobacter arsenicus]